MDNDTGRAVYDMAKVHAAIGAMLEAAARRECSLLEARDAANAVAAAIDAMLASELGSAPEKGLNYCDLS